MPKHTQFVKHRSTMDRSKFQSVNLCGKCGEVCLCRFCRLLFCFSLEECFTLYLINYGAKSGCELFCTQVSQSVFSLWFTFLLYLLISLLSLRLGNRKSRISVYQHCNRLLIKFFKNCLCQKTLFFDCFLK